MAVLNVTMPWSITFPSPCGEKVGINGDFDGDPVNLLLAVSVPLRGKGRDQPYPRKSLNPCSFQGAFAREYGDFVT